MQKTRTKHIDFFTKRVYNRFQNRCVENPRIRAKNSISHIEKQPNYYPSVINCRKEKKPAGLRIHIQIERTDYVK